MRPHHSRPFLSSIIMIRGKQGSCLGYNLLAVVVSEERVLCGRGKERRTDGENGTVLVTWEMELE